MALMVLGKGWPFFWLFFPKKKGGFPFSRIGNNFFSLSGPKTGPFLKLV